MNVINIIYPYKYESQWVFDDESRGLDKEAFVSGMPEMIESILSLTNIGITTKEFPIKFKFMFSEIPFPNNFGYLEWDKSDISGNYLYKYSFGSYHYQGWLYPLLEYFDKPPHRIYFKADPLIDVDTFFS